MRLPSSFHRGRVQDSPIRWQVRWWKQSLEREGFRSSFCLFASATAEYSYCKYSTYTSWWCKAVKSLVIFGHQINHTMHPPVMEIRWWLTLTGKLEATGFSLWIACRFVGALPLFPIPWNLEWSPPTPAWKCSLPEPVRFLNTLSNLTVRAKELISLGTTKLLDICLPH